MDKRAGLAGVLAAAGGVAVAELAGALLGVRQTPIVALGAAFIDIVPPWLKDFAIALFGTWDKVVLVVGILVVLAAVSGGIGVLAAKRRWIGQVSVGGIAVVAAVLAYSRPSAGPLAVVPALVGGVVALIVLGMLLSRFSRTPEAGGPPGRRQLLVTGGLVLVGAGLVAGAGRLIGGRRSGVEAARETVRETDRLPVPQQPPGAELSVDGLATWRTPNPEFYRIDTTLAEPLIDPRDWRLRIHGMVERPLTLSYADLRKRKVVHRWVTLACVSNQVGGSLVGNALWTGVPIADILAEAGVRTGADAVKSTSEDGWTCGTPLSALTDGRDSLLAFGMNGEPLPVEHGFPVRMVVPGLYGFVSATKWVVDIEVTRFDRFKAYWSTRGWSERAPIKTASRIDVPRTGADVAPGRVVVAGVAWAQQRGIARVDVRVDDGPWKQARLAGQPTKDSWRQWRFDWEAEAGSHKLQVRATDGRGRVQTGALAPPAPDGATGYHSIDVNVG